MCENKSAGANANRDTLCPLQAQCRAFHEGFVKT